MVPFCYCMSLNLFLRKLQIKLIEDGIRWISRFAGHGSENKLNHEFNWDEKTIDINEQSGKRAKNFLESCTNFPY
jgi:hypothetical protein